MVLYNEHVRQLYDRTAQFYDAALLAYRLAGINRRRAATMDALNLRPGATVVDLGCGSAANLAMLVRKVGQAGRVIGIDLSPDMLAKARRKIDQNGGIASKCGATTSEPPICLMALTVRWQRSRSRCCPTTPRLWRA
ncbi:MAG: hypothetical protein CMN72_15485 [Sphingomonas sp.]|nr:hypothetical protein [Sphingomonas sp.]